MRKKQNGGWKLSDTDWFYFSFYNPSCFFLWSELIRVQFYFIFIFSFDASRSDPDWRSELIRSDFCTCLAKMFLCPMPKISHAMMKWCRRASHLGRFTLWNNGRRATQLSRLTLWQYGHLATQLSKFTLWHNGRRAKQPGLMHAPGLIWSEILLRVRTFSTLLKDERFGRFIKHRSIAYLQQTPKYARFTKIQRTFKRWTIYEDRIKGNLLFWCIKRANRSILWYWKSQENVRVLWFIHILETVYLRQLKGIQSSK